MPPKAQGRRRQPSSKGSRRGSDASTGSGFSKPNLPGLRGTPSARRQYSYGAGAEPAPARQGSKTKGVLDLGNAVRNVIGRHDDEEAFDLVRTRSNSTVDPDEDELAGGPDMQPMAGPQGRGLFQTIQNALNGSSNSTYDADDARSFGMESDYYGDATIASTPGGMPPPPRPNHSDGTGQRRHQPLGSSPEPEPRPAYRPRLDPSRGKNGSSKNPPVRNFALPDDEDELTAESEGERDPSAKPIKLRHGAGLNAAAARRQDFVLEIPATRNGILERPNPRQTRSVDEDFEEMKRKLSRATQATVPSGFFSDKPYLPPHGANGRPSQQPPDRGQHTEKRHKNVTFAERRRWQLPWNRTTDRYDFSEGSRPAINWWQLLNPWTHVKAVAWVLLNIAQRFFAAIQGLVSGRQRRHDHPRFRPPLWQPLASFWQLLLSIWQLSVSMWRFVVDTVQSVIDFIYSLFPAGAQEHFSYYADWLPYAYGIIIAVALGIILSSVRSQTWRRGAGDDMWEPTDGGSRWSLPRFPSISRVSVPSLSIPSLSIPSLSIPSLSLPSMSWSSSSRRWEDIIQDDLNDITPAKVEQILKKMGRNMDALGSADQLHETAIKRLETIVPSVVHMELKDGRPVVAPDFYHALRDLMRQDELILTFDMERGDFDATSERQWKAILARLSNDPSSSTNGGSNSSGKGSSAEPSSGTWESWLKENQARVQKMIGSEAQNKTKSAETEGKSGTTYPDGKVVGRDEYMKHLKNEVATLRADMRAEVEEMRPKMEKLVRDAIELAKGENGMTRAEITALVNGLVRRGVSDINLQAVANGKIHAHWDADLKNQVNYFSIGTGAVADPRHSSPIYDPFSSQYFSLEDQRYASVHKPLGPLAALMPWKDVGDCFCAARSRSRRGNPHGASLAVLLAYRVIPQHIVIEHILPGATPEPGARPRDIEVYGDFPDGALRSRVRDYSYTHFPNPPTSNLDWDYTPADLPERFVKIAQFVYQGAEVHDGVHVQRLSTELLTLGAATDHVVVRAVSNYGARNQTCFYRVRLYGENIDLAEADAGRRMKNGDGGHEGLLGGISWLKRPW
ncbi:hypothetical protein JDV02_003192 [Purpureocillium takamizusanense]|uniref:SUN domain-containing protein n=1 Tax=Purpureocillium takamizusanense TaxID=2060973 RepID=A0A9Q8V9E9_9HYPO|nr:uncharacterized protein JDV02_003192 [Purpureocillium takamizusanense]UNI16789.1 hypothetical protein JDV02_003192 [Purpureocillium takamizusanense]